uniref:Uncharacterized protein n=1 Tax=Rousettus aegyptiacus TaxID=9407 RepID=A0A7J8F0P8_ROUAE|nr:hypothetical protein HJG63_012346 [Rousettus aegyptiacus]
MSIFYFIVARALNMRSTFSLNQLINVYHSIVIYRHNVLQHISRTYSSCITQISYSFIINPPFHCPSPGKPTILCFASMSLTILDTLYRFEVCNIWPSVTGLFHLAKCPQGLFMLLHIAEFPFLNYIIFIVRIYHILKIHSSFNGYLGCFHILIIMNGAKMHKS